MITKTKSVYYCNYCSKHGLRKDTISNHEKHCTLNPDRYCRLCERQTKEYQVTKPPVLKPQKVKDSFGFDITKESDQARKYVEELKNKIDCPWCVFSLLRKDKLLFDLSGFWLKTELDEYWKERNEEEDGY